MRDRMFYQGVLLGCALFVVAGLVGLADRPVAAEESPNQGHEKARKEDEDAPRRPPCCSLAPASAASVGCLGRVGGRP